MPPDPAAEGREAALVANRIRELNTRPPIGEFDRTHLQAVHAYLFQDLPHHRPGEIRGDTSGWSKTRMLEGQTGAHDVHYAPDNVAGRVDKVLRDLGGPAALSGLPPDAFAGRMARLYGDLDHAHSFHEGNSRTLREFTRSLAQAVGYELNWAPTGADAEQRNRLYVARDIAVLERAYPGLTPERGMETNDRYEYEASLALPALRRRGPTLETVIKEGLTPLPGARQEAGTNVTPADRDAAPGRSALGSALAALARHERQASLPDAPLTSIADRLQRRDEAKPSSSADPSPAKPEEPTPPAPGYRPSTGPGF